jgi:non-ribosomal peptide synthetase component F
VRFDFELALDETPNGLRGRFDYNTDLFRPETAVRLCDQYQALLERIIANPAKRLSELAGFIPPRSAVAPNGDVRPDFPRRAPTAAAASPDGAPRTSTEQTLLRIWSEALEVEHLSIHDDFFAVGGHSLLAAQVVARLRSELGIDLDVQRFFEVYTVAELAEVVEPLIGRSPRDQVLLLGLLEAVERMSDEEVAERLGNLGQVPSPRHAAWDGC